MKEGGCGTHPLWQRTDTKGWADETWWATLALKRVRTSLYRSVDERLAQGAPHHDFPDDVIALAVRWCVRFRLSYADVVEWFAERGLVVNRSTIYRWVLRFLPPSWLPGTSLLKNIDGCDK